jgi:hypothetical protein
MNATSAGLSLKFRDSSNDIGFIYPCQLVWQVDEFAQLL